MGAFSDWLDSDEGTVTPGGTPAAQETSVPALATPSPAPFSDFLDAEPDAGPAVKAAVETNPDQAAKNQQLSRKTGLPVEAIEADPLQAEQAVRGNDILNMLADAPSTNTWMGDISNAQVAHDDVENLVGMERALAARNNAPIKEDDFLTAMQKTFENAPEMFQQIAAGAIQYLGEREPIAGTGFGLDPFDPQYQSDVVDTFREFRDAPNNPLRNVGQQLYNAAAQDIAANAPNVDPDSVTGYAVDITNSLIQMAPVLLSTAITRSPGVGAALMGVEVGGQQYGTARNEYGRTPEEARQDAAVYALAEGLPETLPLSSLFRSGRFLPNLLKTAGLEGAQEMFTQMIETGYDSQTINPDMTWGEAWDQIQRAGIVGAFTGAGMHAVASPFVKEQNEKVATTETLNPAVEEATAIMQSSKLAERDPERLASFAKQLYTDYGLNSVGVDPAAMIDLARKEGQDPVEFMVQMGAKQKQAWEAVKLGHDVQIPIDNFITQIATTDYYPVLKDNIRYHEDALTNMEAEEYKSSGLKDEVARVANSAVPVQVEVTPEMITELQDAGFTPEEIKALTPNEIAGLTDAQPDAVTVAQPVSIATQQMGLQGLFKTAAEAGVTDKAYQGYLLAIQQGADKTVENQRRALLKEEQRKTEATYQAERETVRQSQQESISQEPVYSALNAIGRERINRDLAEQAAGASVDLDYLPKQKGRNIFTAKGEVGGIDPDVLALEHGFTDGREMLHAMIQAPSLEQAVEAATDNVMAERYPTLLDRREAIQRALESLHNDSQAQVLAMEVNMLRQAKKEKRVSARLLKQAAKDYMRENVTVGEVSPNKFITASKKLGRAAAKVLRKGERTLAADLKYRQLLNFQMAQQAFNARNQIAKDLKYLKKFRKPVKGLPENFQDMIKGVLDDVQLSGKMSPRRAKGYVYKAMVDAVNKGETSFDLPQELLDEERRTNYQDMTYGDWQATVDLVKHIEYVGKRQDKMRKLDEKRTRQQIADGVASNILSISDTNVDPYGVQSGWDRIRRVGREAIGITLSADTILRKIDGWKDLGTAYRAIKEGYDRAISSGYNKGQIGYTRRQEKEAKAVLDIWKKHFSKKEMLNLSRKNLSVPGFDRPVSHDFVLSVLLNSGNTDNIAAMTNAKVGGLTPAQIASVQNFASARDWKFAEDVHKYLEGLWPEIADTQLRRTGRTPDKVEGKTITLPHGSYELGYYPIRYDNQRGISGTTSYKADKEWLDEQIANMRSGRAVQSHTRRGHTIEREGSGGKSLQMTTGVLNTHLQTVLYDLEVGDALADSYSILMHPTVKQAFAESNRKDLEGVLHTWLDDVVSGELFRMHNAERFMRYIRNGYTISKLGFSVGTAALQPLGVIQSGVVIGNQYILKGAYRLLRGKQGWNSQIGANSIYNEVNAQSPFMAQRMHTLNNNIADASRILSNSLIKRITPGDTAKYIKPAAFYMLLKAQRVADYVTWMGAKEKALDQGMTSDEAIEYADRMVARSQGSGIFGDRTSFERGTAGPIKQTEFIRSLVPLISYFMTKNNVAYEKTSKTNFKNPGQVLKWAGDMVQLYTLEALIVAAVKGQWPDDDDDESIAAFIAKQTAASMVAGIPVINSFAQEAQGFRSGGSLSGAIGQFGALAKQVGQGEVDEALMRSAIDNLGVAFHLPSAQINRAIRTYDKSEEESLDLHEWVFGPDYNN